MTSQYQQELPQPVPGLLPWQSYFLAFVAGVFAFQYPVPALAAFGILILTDTAFRGWLHRLPLLVFVGCLAFGFGYASQRAHVPAEVEPWMEARQVAYVEGVVDRVESRVGGSLRVILDDVTCTVQGERNPLVGMVTWNWRKPDATPTPGQSFSAPMRVVPVRGFGNLGSWDYGWYWQRQGVNWRAWVSGKGANITWGAPPENWLWNAKVTLRKAVADALVDFPGGGMVLALVTGDRSGIERSLQKETQRAGLAHTLALSGLHVSFVAAMGLALAWLAGLIYPPLLLSIPRLKLAVICAAPLVVGYAWLGQPSQSLIRATTMFAFWGFLLLQGRGRVLMDGLFFALAVIVFVSPFSVFDLSLQMSAVAVAGIGLLYPTLRRMCRFGQTPFMRALGWSAGVLGISVCANIALLPLLSSNFGTWTPNLLLNLLWIPVLGCAVMPLGLLGALLVPFAWTAPLGSLFLGWAATLMQWLLLALHATSELGFTPVYAVLRPLWPEVIGCALLLVLAVVAWVNRRIQLGLAGVGFLLMVAPHVFVMVQDTRDEVRLTVYDVGLGQSALISTPGGHRWLIDGAGGSRSFDRGESVVAPSLTHGRPPRLDGVFMSHPDTDHSYGIPFILSRFDVGAFYTNGSLPRKGTRTGDLMRSVLKKRGLSPSVLKAGDILELGSGVAMEVVHPAADYKNRHANERSLVLRLIRYGKGLGLIPGDIESDGVDALMASGVDISADVLVLPHHGSRSTLVPEFYRAVAPRIALCSNGYLNRYGFPHEEVVRSLDAPVYTTAVSGQLAVIWGEGLGPFVQSFYAE